MFIFKIANLHGNKANNYWAYYKSLQQMKRAEIIVYCVVFSVKIREIISLIIRDILYAVFDNISITIEKYIRISTKTLFYTYTFTLTDILLY